MCDRSRTAGAGGPGGLPALNLPVLPKRGMLEPAVFHVSICPPLATIGPCREAGSNSCAGRPQAITAFRSTGTRASWRRPWRRILRPASRTGTKPLSSLRPHIGASSQRHSRPTTVTPTSSRRKGCSPFVMQTRFSRRSCPVDVRHPFASRRSSVVFWIRSRSIIRAAAYESSARWLICFVSGAKVRPRSLSKVSGPSLRGNGASRFCGLPAGRVRPRLTNRDTPGCLPKSHACVACVGLNASHRRGRPCTQ